MSDYAGHRGTQVEAIELLETFDAVFAGLLMEWDLQNDLIVLTSDHGNVEDMSGRKHTLNPVPALIIGPLAFRRLFTTGLKDLTSFYPAVMHALFGDSSY